MISFQEENIDEPIHSDRIFSFFAFLIFLWGVAEFLFPPSGDFFERSIPKLIHAAILFWSFIGIVYDVRTSFRPIQFKNVMFFGAILVVILFIFPMFTYNRINDDLIPFIRTKFYAGFFITQWYVVLLFCSIHTQVNPRAYQVFLKFVPVIVLAFFFASRRHANINISIRTEELQSGIYSGYYLAVLFPFAWDVRNKILKIFLLLLIISGTIYSMKRGAMLCLASSLLVSFFTYYTLYAKGLKRIPYLFGVAIVLGALLLASAFFISQKEATFENRMNNINAGSGRIDLYKTSWQIFKTLPAEEKIFGAQERENQIRSHNDFLFTLVNFGIIGFFAFVLFNIGFIFLAFQAFSRGFPTIPSLIAALGNILIIEMISYALEGHAFMLCCIYIGLAQGYLLSDIDDEDTEIIEIDTFQEEDFKEDEQEEETPPYLPDPFDEEGKPYSIPGES